MAMLEDPIHRVRVLGLIEGVSLILVLGIGSTLKRLAGIHEPVQVLGMIHGVLFLLFLLVVAHAFWARHLNARLAGLACLLSVVPFGFFFIDGRLKRLRDEGTQASTPAE